MTIVLCSELCARFALSERGSEKDRYFNIRVVVGIDTYIHTVSPKIINTFDLFHAKFWFLGGSGTKEIGSDDPECLCFSVIAFGIHYY